MAKGALRPEDAAVSLGFKTAIVSLSVLTQGSLRQCVLELLWIAI